MTKKHLAYGVSAAALLLALAAVPAHAQEALPAIDIGAAQRAPAPEPGPAAEPAPVVAPPASVMNTPPGFSPERLKQPVYRDPPGQTITTVDTKHFENESVFTVGDLLDYSPGVTIAQGNSARDVVISIRGSGARTSTGLSNIVVLEDGFSETTANGGAGLTLNLDPHAFGAVDVYRGGSSALWGNFAMEGAVNFRMRSGAEIDGFELGNEYGSYGAVQNWLVAGKKVGDFDISLFASNVQGDGYMFHTDYSTQTFDLLGTWTPTPNDRLILKVVQNDWFSHMDGRETWMQYTLNPMQRGYGCAYLITQNSPFCTAVQGGAQPADGIVVISGNKLFPAAATQSPDEIGMHRRISRDIVGLRYEHDFDSQTTWRTQALYDLLEVQQPNNPTQSVVGPTAAVNTQTDITSHIPIFGLQATHFLQFFYANAHVTNNAYWTIPYNFNQGAMGALATAQSNFSSDIGLKAREELALTKQLTGVVGFSSTWSKLYGFQDAIKYTSTVSQSQPSDISAAHAYWNYAPEATLAYRYSPDWLIRARYETAYGTPAAGVLFTDSTGNPGNNTNLKAQTSQGGDVGVDWTPAGWNLKGSLTYYHEWWRNQFISQLAANGVAYTSNIPASIHRGVEATLEWRPYDGWKVLGNYSFNDQFFTNLNDTLSATVAVQRDGERLPGVPLHQLTGRVGYDQPYGLFKGLGGFVEYQYRGDYPMDNANLIWAPGYGIINLDLHYNRDIENSFLKKFSIYFGVKNVFDHTYISSVTVITDSLVSAKNVLQNPAAVLAGSASVIPGSPRAFTVGMKLKF